jgi:hypothetical protein
MLPCCDGGEEGYPREEGLAFEMPGGGAASAHREMMTMKPALTFPRGNFFWSETVYRKDTQYSDAEIYWMIEMEAVRPLWPSLKFATGRFHRGHKHVRSCLMCGVATSANDLRPALIAGLTPDVSSDPECMRQLRGRVLAAQVVAVLVLMMTPGILAQLPDAPMPAAGVQGAQSSKGDADAIQNSLQLEWTAGAVESTAETLDKATTAEFSSSVAGPQPVAFVEEDAFDAQQSFAPSPKRQFQPTLSSSTAYRGEVPGAAPALHNTCPVDACAVHPLDMCCGHISSPFAQYLKWPDVVPLTARDNLRSAVRGVIDPFNLMTIAGDAAVGIGSDSHTAYGPGFEGFAKYAGVSLTEDMTGEFFGTFLVPSLVHQDPHYHREPYMPIKHRFLHTVVQVVWTQGYNGEGMFNYANFIGGAATAVVSNTFVPGPNRQGFSATAKRLALAFAISPSGNIIEEFVPDLASHVNLRVVIFQRILNSVTLEESGVTP